MSAEILVSVCIPTYNRRKMLLEALESVTSQLPAECEVVISDNGSTDGSPDAVRNALSTSVKLVGFEHNLGAGLNHLNCVHNCSGEWILFLHDDDRLVPGALAQVTRFLASVGTSAIVLPDYVSNLSKGNLLENTLRLLNGISPSSTLYRRDFFVKHAPPPENDCGDWEILVIAAWYEYEFAFYPFSYIERGSHGGQESRRITIDGSGNRVKADFARRLADLIPKSKWMAICANISRDWNTEELMTLARHFHHGGCFDHFSDLKAAASRNNKWKWASSKGVYIASETLLGPSVSDALLESYKRTFRRMR